MRADLCERCECGVRATRTEGVELEGVAAPTLDADAVPVVARARHPRFGRHAPAKPRREALSTHARSGMGESKRRGANSAPRQKAPRRKAGKH
eukprot:310937-Pleurochrysis_carterae.AAC.5